MTDKMPGPSNKKAIIVVLAISLVALFVIVVIPVGFVAFAIISAANDKTSTPASQTEQATQDDQSTAVQTSISPSAKRNDAAPASTVTGPDRKEIKIGASIQTRPITFVIERVVMTKSLHTVRDYAASDTSIYVLVYFSARNHGQEPFSQPYRPFFILTEDGTRFEPDQSLTSSVRDAENFDWELELQPGLHKQAVNVFEMPIEQLKKKPTLCIETMRDPFTGKIPLFSNNQPAANKPEDSQDVDHRSDTGPDSKQAAATPDSTAQESGSSDGTAPTR